MKPSRFLGTLVVAVWLAVLVSAFPALAGTEDDPEIVGQCGEGANYLNTYTPWADICAAWWEDVWRDSVEEDLDAIRVTIRVAGDIESRPPAALYRATWQNEDCRQGWFFSDEDAGTSAYLAFFERCSSESESRSTALSTMLANFEDDRITVTLPIDAIDTVTQRPIAVGSVLREPTVRVLVSAKTSAGPMSTAEWTGAGPGRDFVVGQTGDS